VCVFYADRKSKMATTTGHRLTLDPRGKCSNCFSEATNMIKAKLYMNIHWMVLYKLCVFCFILHSSYETLLIRQKCKQYILKWDAVGSILKQTKRKHQLTIKTCTKYVDKKSPVMRPNLQPKIYKSPVIPFQYILFTFLSY
jgi:hypothetical protein